MKEQNVSETFRDLFLPNGQAPLAGLLAKRPDLAAILDNIAANGISEFYSGNLTQEMTSVVCLQCHFYYHYTVFINIFLNTAICRYFLCASNHLYSLTTKHIIIIVALFCVFVTRFKLKEVCWQRRISKTTPLSYSSHCKLFTRVNTHRFTPSSSKRPYESLKCVSVAVYYLIYCSSLGLCWPSQLRSRNCKQQSNKTPFCFSLYQFHT